MTAAAPEVPDRGAFGRWLFALKPLSWPKLLWPCLLGQALGAWVAGSLDLAGMFWGVGFTVFGLAYIVLLNDFRDRSVDRVKREMFPETSPKTIPDRVLTAPQVLLGGLASGALALAFAAWATAYGKSWAVLVAAAVSMLVFACYSLPPVQLNYRGGGELLEALGVAVLLPGVNLLCQVPTAFSDPGTFPAALALLPGVLPLSLASAVASGLADEDSDRAGGKRTVVTIVGNPASRQAIALMVQLAIGGFLLAAAGWLLFQGAWGMSVRDGVFAGTLLAAAMVVRGHSARLRVLSRDAGRNCFSGQRSYKGQLHQLIGRAMMVLISGLLAASLFAPPG